MAVAIGFGCVSEAYADVQEIVITGSRIKSNGFDAPTPVTTVSSEEIHMSGSVNIEQILATTPQFIPSTNGGQFSNTAPGGQAYLNLRGLGQARNIVLVNGRRYTIQGTDLTTDINTIPAALVDRTEVVTGGSSAVYGSDAIAGVVNFIMKSDFQGVEVDGHYNSDSVSETPTYSTDITVGGNFNENRGNIAVAIDYLNRGSVARSQIPYAVPAMSDGCVTPASFSSKGIGTTVLVNNANPTGQACLNAGGVMGFIKGGSGDIPDGRFLPVPATLLPGTGTTASAALLTAYANAGLGGLSSNNGFGWTFNDAGAAVRPALTPNDLYNNSLPNYLQIPDKRWMVNSFGHYDFTPHIQGYVEMHFSNNSVTALLAPSNVNSTFLYNTNSTAFAAIPGMTALVQQLDASETGTICSGLISTVCTTANDGIVALTSGRRFTDVGPRVNDSERVAWRFAGGFRGDLPDVSPTVFRDLTYDAYYMYARTNETDSQTGAVSKSHIQTAILGTNPVCDIFGQSITPACAAAIGITSTNTVQALMEGGAATVSGTLFQGWDGPIQFVGTEYRYSLPSTSRTFSCSQVMSRASTRRRRPTVMSPFRKSSQKSGFRSFTTLLMVKSLTLNGAYRYSNYSLKGVGAVKTYSYGGDWRPIEDISFRGQFQHAIRAPNVGELYGGNATNFLTVADPCKTAPADPGPGGDREEPLHRNRRAVGGRLHQCHPTHDIDPRHPRAATRT